MYGLKSTLSMRADGSMLILARMLGMHRECTPKVMPPTTRLDISNSSILGWGKKLSYCIAFSVDGATDVTRRYIRDFTKYGKSRNRASEEALIYIIQDIRAKRRDWLNQEAKEQLRQEDMMEESELQMYIVRRITRDVIGHPGSMTDSLPSKSGTSSTDLRITYSDSIA